MGYSKEEAIKHIESQEGDSIQFEVYTDKEHTTFIENHVKDQIDKSIGDNALTGDNKTAIRIAFDKEHYQTLQKFDDDYHEVMGVHKPKDVKTHAAFKQTLTDLKSKADLLPGLQDENEKLKKGGDVDEALKRENEDLRNKFTEYKDESDKKMDDLKKEQSGFRVKGEIDRATLGFKFKKDIPDNVRKTYIDDVQNRLANIAEYDSDGKLVFMKDGVIWKNRDNGMSPYTAKELIQKELSNIIDADIKIDGPGVKPKIAKTDGKDDIMLDIPDGITTTEQLHKHLISLGLTRNSKEYDVAWEKYSPDLKRPGF